MITVKIENADQMRKELTEFGKALNKEASEIIKEIARNGAKNAANTTFPRGTTSKTRDSLTKAVYRDIIKSYEPHGNVTVTDDGSYLEGKRGTKGRVRDYNNRMKISYQSYEDIRAKKTKTIGLVKAAWMEGANSIGTTRIRVPVWLRKDYSFGDSTVTGNDWQTSVEVKNNVDYASNVISDNQLRRILTSTYSNYMSYIDRRMNALANKV